MEDDDVMTSWKEDFSAAMKFCRGRVASLTIMRMSSIYLVYRTMEADYWMRISRSRRPKFCQAARQTTAHWQADALKVDSVTNMESVTLDDGLEITENLGCLKLGGTHWWQVLFEKRKELVQWNSGK